MNRLTQYARNLRPIELSTNPGSTELDELTRSLEPVSDEVAFFANFAETCWFGGDETSPWDPDLTSPYLQLANYQLQRRIKGPQSSMDRKTVISIYHTWFNNTFEGKPVARLDNRTTEQGWEYCFIPELEYDPDDIANLRNYAVDLAVQGLSRIVHADKSDYELSRRISQHIDRKSRLGY